MKWLLSPSVCEGGGGFAKCAKSRKTFPDIFNDATPIDEGKCVETATFFFTIIAVRLAFFLSRVRPLLREHVCVCLSVHEINAWCRAIMHVSTHRSKSWYVPAHSGLDANAKCPFLYLA